MFIENNILATQRLITEYERHSNIIIGVDFDDTINDTFNKGHVNIPVLVDVLILTVHFVYGQLTKTNLRFELYGKN